MFHTKERKKYIINPHFDRKAFDAFRDTHALTVFHCSWELTGDDLQSPQQLESQEHMAMNIHSTNQIYFNHATLRQTAGQTSVDMESLGGILPNLSARCEAYQKKKKHCRVQKDSLQE